MVIMLGIALVSVIAMYLLYPYCNRYVRVENTEHQKKERSIIIKRILLRPYREQECRSSRKKR